MLPFLGRDYFGPQSVGFQGGVRSGIELSASCGLPTYYNSDGDDCFLRKLSVQSSGLAYTWAFAVVFGAIPYAWGNLV